MDFRHDPQWGEEIDKMILELLWTKKTGAQGENSIRQKTAHHGLHLQLTQSFLF